MSICRTADRNKYCNLILAAGVFIVALIARLVYLREISGSPAFNVPIVDSSTYCEIGRQISGGVLDPRLFWQSFIYPLYLALVFLVSGQSILAARSAQLVAGAFSAGLVYYLGATVFDRKTGLAAAVAAAFYGPLIFFETELLATGWEAFWAVALVSLFIKTSGGKEMRLFLLTGIAGGLSTLTRVTFLPFFVLASAWLIVKTWRNDARVTGNIARTACLAGPFLVMIIIVASLSHNVTGHFSAIPKSGSINLYIGNNPDTDRTMMIRPGSEWRDLTREPEIRGIYSDAGHRKYFMDLYSEYVVTQPLSFMKGLFQKTLQFISSRELPRNIDVYTVRKYSGFMAAAAWKWNGFGFPFGIILPFAVIGLVMNFRKIPSPMILFLLVYPISIILVFVSSMYRTAVVPVMLVTAAAGFWNLVELTKRKNRKRMVLSAVLSAVVIVISTAPGPFVTERYDYDAEFHACVGYELGRMGKLPEAENELSLALEMDPDYGSAHRMLGNILNQQDRPEEALVHLESALSGEPESYITHYYLGITLLRLDRKEEAFEQLRTAMSGAVAAKEEMLAGQIRKLLQARPEKE